jgi:hypothetical protein
MKKQQPNLPDQQTIRDIYAFLHKKKRGPGSERVKKDKAYKPFRDNSKIFTASSSTGARLRKALFPLTSEISDSDVHSRMQKYFCKVVKTCQGNTPHTRNVLKGLETAAGREALTGFDFNDTYRLNKILKARSALVNGNITVHVRPNADLTYPKGATHCELKGAVAYAINDPAEFSMVETNAVLLERKFDTPVSVVLAPVKKLPSGGPLIYVLRILFFQLQGNELYRLEEKRCAGVAGVGT